MGTTDSGTLTKALEALAFAGVGFAFLHGEDRAAGGQLTSDADLIVDRPAAAAVAAAREALEDVHLDVICLVQYDSAAYSAFIINRVTLGGAQIDLVFDPCGIGEYGICTPAALKRAIQGVRWPKVDPTTEAAYRSRKRAWKDRRQHYQSFPVRLKGGVPRAIHRALRPVGFWAHVDDVQSSPDLRRLEDLASLLPGGVHIGANASGLGIAERYKCFRPLLLVTMGRPPGLCRPDLRIPDSPNTEGEMISSILATMAKRCLSTQVEGPQLGRDFA